MLHIPVTGALSCLGRLRTQTRKFGAGMAYHHSRNAKRVELLRL